MLFLQPYQITRQDTAGKSTVSVFYRIRRAILPKRSAHVLVADLTGVLTGFFTTHQQTVQGMDIGAC